MKSKGQHMAAAKRRGRTRKPNVARTDTGRISRAREPKEDTRMVALQARERHTGLPAALASHEKAGTVLGRMFLRDEITGNMWEAGEQYLKLRDAAQRAIKAPDGLAKGGVPNAGGDLITDDYITWAIGAVARFKAVRHRLHRDELRVVESVVVRDEECGNWQDRGLLTLALMRLVMCMGIGEQVAA